MPAGKKPLPESERVDKRVRQAVPWKYADGIGWRHGKIPAAPSGLSATARKTWRIWMGSWWASFYEAEDLPGLELLIRIYDRVLAEELDPPKLYPLMERYGITPNARINLRWAPPAGMPVEDAAPDVADEVAARRAERRSRLA